jgi:biotin operon repressor
VLVKEKIDRAHDKYNATYHTVLHDMRISANAYRLYSILFTSGDTYNPNEASLASQLGVSVRSIKNWIKELKHFGYMTITGNQTKGYIWIIHKHSKGTFDLTKQGAKYCTLKNRKNIESNVQDTAPNKVTNIAPFIRTIAPTTVGSTIANKSYDENVEKIDTTYGINNDN